MQNESTDEVVEEAADKAAEYLAGWRRAQADYANLQRETVEARSQMGKLATAEAVRAFLPVYDYFKRAMQHTPPEAEQSASVKNWFTGTQHIGTMFKMTLLQLGVEEIETVGKPFDPMTMESVKEEYKEGVASGTVISETDGGYKLGNKVITAARVIVAADKPQA